MELGKSYTVNTGTSLIDAGTKVTPDKDRKGVIITGETDMTLCNIGMGRGALYFADSDVTEAWKSHYGPDLAFQGHK